MRQVIWCRKRLGGRKPYYPASFRSFAESFFSKHSREQYAEKPELRVIARSAGIHVPQLTHRISLCSALVFLCCEETADAVAPAPPIAVKTFRTS